MMEYRMSSGNKVLYSILAAGFSGMGAFGIYWAVHISNPGFLIPGIMGAGFGFLFYRMVSKMQMTIDEYSITVCNGFSTNSILLDEVAGFRRGDKEGIVLVRKNGEKPLSIPGTVERRKELLDWLQERFPDINAQAAAEVTEEVLHDERYGLTEEDRSRRLSQARKLTLYSAFVLPLFFVWVMLSARSPKLLTMVLLALPLVAVWLTWSYKGILRLYMSKAKPYPTLLMVVFISELAGFLAVMRGFDIYLFDGRFWGLTAALSVVVLLVWAAACRAAMTGEKNPFVLYLGMLILAGLYSFNVLIFSNCTFDHQRAEISRVGIDGKHINHGKNTTYTLELSPWGRFTDGKNVMVPWSFYHSVKTGDSVNVYLHPGKWGIAWYEVLPD
jgi:hypothetical protein